MKDNSDNKLVQTKQSNYLNPNRFYNDFLDYLVVLDELHDNGRPNALDANHLYWAARVQYSIAGRISEILDLEPNDFDLNHRILTLPETKTGWKHCKCAKWEKNKLLSVDENCKFCKGEAWIRVPQKTTILPYDIPKLEKFLESHDKDEVIFKVSRGTMWRYYKNASILGGLNLFEAKDVINIEGAWTHLLRSSCAKMYEDLGAKESLIAKNLRHSPGRNVTARYTKVDIGTLLDWEWDNLQEIPKF